MLKGSPLRPAVVHLPAGDATMTDNHRSSDGRAGWLRDPELASPTVLILGGFLTAPPMYGPLVRRLLDRGAAGAVVADVWTPDWLIAGVRGIGPICTRSGKALRDAVRLSSTLSAGAPLLVVGHSAGGITGRLLTAPEPLPGRRLGAARWVGALVTLGTPHRLAAGQGIGRRIRDVATLIADEKAPGAFHAPWIGYLSVASRAVVGDPGGNGRARVAHLMYRSIIGRAAALGTDGDGLVPVAATHLDGARHLVIDGAIHGPGGNADWYGSTDAVDAWWPLAMETWRSTLATRAAEREGVAV
jgi:hypothetical protein